MAWTQKADLKGTSGDAGADGAAGTQWFVAASAPTEEPGATAVAAAVTGDYYLDSTTGHLYVLEA